MTQPKLLPQMDSGNGTWNLSHKFLGQMMSPAGSKEERDKKGKAKIKIKYKLLSIRRCVCVCVYLGVYTSINSILSMILAGKYHY